MVVGKGRKLLKAIKAAANDDDPCSNTLGQPKFRALEGVANDDDLANPGVKAIECVATEQGLLLFQHSERTKFSCFAIPSDP